MDDQSRFASTLEDFGHLLDLEPNRLRVLLEEDGIDSEACGPWVNRLDHGRRSLPARRRSLTVSRRS